MGFMANNVLPLRAGEIVRPFAVARLADVRFTTAFASIAVERIFDALTIVLLLTLALASSGLGADVAIGGVPVSRLAGLAAAVSAAGLVAGSLVVARPLAAERLVRRLVPSARLADRLVALIEGIRQGLAALDSPRRVAPVILWSLVHWLVNAASFWVCFAAFDIPVGFAGALLVQGLLVFGVSVPSTPGYVGPFEAAIVAGLALYGVSEDRSFSYALAYHVTTFIPIVLLGLWYTVRTGVGFGGAAARARGMTGGAGERRRGGRARESQPAASRPRPRGRRLSRSRDDVLPARSRRPAGRRAPGQHRRLDRGGG